MRLRIALGPLKVALDTGEYEYSDLMSEPELAAGFRGSAVRPREGG